MIGTYMHLTCTVHYWLLMLHQDKQTTVYVYCIVGERQYTYGVGDSGYRLSGAKGQ